MERETALQVLRSALARAADGHGSAVLLTGESGIGKTSVVQAFLAGMDGGVHVLAGACDDLLTPRTLGPLRDAAAGSGGPLEHVLGREQAADAVFDSIIEELTGRVPRVLVVEDLHWVDDATVDVLYYLARRLDDLPAVLVLTFREDAVDLDHPLQRLLAAFGSTGVHRLTLRPLSVTAVSRLCAGTGRDAAMTHALTGGNPFYVTEVLAAPPDQIPPTISDTVLARLRPLSPDCRLALEQLAVLPTRAGFDLIDALLGSLADTLAEAEARGIIEVGADGVAYCHELGRRAVEQSLPAIRRRALHRDVVRVLRAQPRPEPARLVHHAIQAADAVTVAEYAPQTGRRAVTRAGPGGLTARQLDVLALVSSGMTNAEIAQRLVLSVRTVEHHVSAILTKLGAQSRREAVLAARTLIGPAPGEGI
ncbi:MAG TPA: AAA family ATPase [Pseudonocardiaceae bacterium]|nr:AAA family ATPase [Pseudonocardiaceae bacterium]